MSSNFRIDVKKHNGELYVSPKGDFDGSSAWELINTIDARYEGVGRVFIDTHHLRELCRFGCSVFLREMRQGRIPVDRVRYLGLKGHDIAPPGSHVEAGSGDDRHECCGDCANCPCGKKKGPHSHPGH